MKGASQIIQAVLIFMIAVSTVIIIIPWVMDSIEKSSDISEATIIKSQLESCSDKIVETARTGAGSTCIFSVRKGDFTVSEEGIYYALSSGNSEICDPHTLVEINSRKHIWQECKSAGDQRTIYYYWYWPVNMTIYGEGLTGSIVIDNSELNDITFNQNVTFRTLTVMFKFEFTPGQKGNVLEFSRASITQDVVVLRVRLR